MIFRNVGHGIYYTMSPCDMSIPGCLAMKSKTINISGIGDIFFEKSRRAKRINLSIRPFKGIRVAVPVYVTFQTAELFVRSKSDWIRSHLPKLSAIEAAALHMKNEHPLDLQAARDILVNRLEKLSKKHGLSYNRVSVRNQKTRWGSCSSKKNINLNINLVRLPQRLMDYAILHELVHTVFMDHSPRFWAKLEKHMPGAKALDAELGEYGLMLL